MNAETTLLNEWRVSRSRAGPEEFLKNFQGKLQTDGYVAYESLAKARGDQTLVGYMKDLFTRLPAAKITQIMEFTLTARAKANAKEKLVAQAERVCGNQAQSCS